MVLHTFTLSKQCPKIKGKSNAELCIKNMNEILIKKFNLIKEKDRYNFISNVIHEPNNHLISLFLCDKNGIEDVPRKKIESQCNDATKYDAKIKFKLNNKTVKCGIIITPEKADQPHAIKCQKLPSLNEVMEVLSDG